MNERYERGLELLQRVDGEGGAQVVDSLKDIAPDVGRYIIEFAFGDIYAREGLSLRDRELATIASLCTQGTCEPQLKVHIRGARNAGLTVEQVIETFVQLIPYVGFPRVLNAISAARGIIHKID
ncbi:carboxymuconolactone decarboxylase family protein [Gordonibacter pamelaeae]|uniref:carboxymuconolactone decarboxylase family protein n=1 Tax=Gordonibacter pamelaeae TaxID=471189 RepID=UPI00242F5786|nr:carboxymuconolactone decarboxylase family protein [Gordonibacter pamelaeae]